MVEKMVDIPELKYIHPKVTDLIKVKKLPKVLLLTGCNNDILAYEIARQILGENTVDLTILGKNNEKITIEDIRKLLDQAQQTAYINNYKVFILLNIEDMGVAATNCLLKTLESPNSYNYFILTTNNISKLLLTLTSRCYKITTQFTFEQIITWLTLNKVPASAQGVLLQLAGGSPTKALDYYNKGYLDKISEINSLIAKLSNINLMQTCNEIVDLFKITKNNKDFNISEFIDLVNYVIIKLNSASCDENKQRKTLELIKHYRYYINNNVVLDNINIIYSILYAICY
ncbi:MAG: hypothetical protein KBD64_03450 [Gammaproteobacteria bacterium]|nr:hypothetical protein [Gammaproteobacteria bacterium]